MWSLTSTSLSISSSSDPTDFNLANNRIKNELPNLISEIKASRL